MVTTRAVKTMAKRALRWIAAAVGIAAAVPAAASTITYYHNDIAGSPVAATNSARQVIWRESYRPYGERLTKSASAKSNDVWFTSRREDSSGLVYMGARHYDPVAGRFVSTDPKGFDEANVMSFGRYTYANDNPYKYVDPDGREPGSLYQRGYAPPPAQIFPEPGLGHPIPEAAALALLVVPGFGRAIAGSVLRGAGGESNLPDAGPVAGGGAKLENLTAEETARIQNAANRTNTEISVVGSRANGTAGPTSDWDYVVPESTNSRTVHSLRSSLPDGPRGLGEPRNQDFSRGTVDSSKPYITFKPE